MQYRPSTIAPTIPEQFPEHYREDGPDLVEFVKQYYEYLDETNDRNFAGLRDIDSTLEGFLKYYKNKYLHNLPFVNKALEDIPFLVKNIGDLYRSKGTSEALELLFKMFYKTEVETYYPASSILSLSDSKWAFSTFIEFLPVQDVSIFPVKKGDRIEGDTSKATAFIDEIVFYNINGVQVPVAYISNVYGKFTNDDGLRVERDGVITYPGKLIYGSIESTNVLTRDATANNVVGNKLKIVSRRTGVDGEATVRTVSDIPTGVVDWQLLDSGWGYAVPEGSTQSGSNYTVGPNSVDTENEILTSTQVLIVAGDEVPDLVPGAAINADNVTVNEVSNGSSTPVANKRLDGTGVVIAYEHPIIYLYAFPESTTTDFDDGAFVIRNTVTGLEEDWPFAPVVINPRATVTSGVGSFEISSMTRYNDSASFSFEKFSNVETVSFLDDIISFFLTKNLDAFNYNMGGRINPNNKDTKIQDALGVTTTSIGSIDEIRVESSGDSYKNNVRTRLRNPTIFPHDLGLIGLTFDVTNFIIQEGDIIEQDIQIEDLTRDSEGAFINSGQQITHTTRGRFVRREGNIFYFQPLSYYPFSIDGASITFKGRALTVESVSRLPENVAGGNAAVEGEAEYLSGQITEINIARSGFRYTSGETVDLVGNDEDDEDKYQQIVAKAKIDVGGMGETAGNWITTTSHLSDNNRFIHDNYYYQQYSYDVSTILDPPVYEKTVKDITHVAGTKLFGTPLIATIDDIRPEIDASVGQTETILKIIVARLEPILYSIYEMIMIDSQGTLLQSRAPLLYGVIHENDSSGVPYITLDPDGLTGETQIALISSWNSNSFDTTGYPEVDARIDALIDHITDNILSVESEFLGLFMPVNTQLFNYDYSLVEPSDDYPDGFSPLMLEVDTTDPSAYSNLAQVTVEAGDFVVGTTYQIVDLGDVPGGNLVWNLAAGTTGQTYSQGSVFRANNNGFNLTNAIVIPALMASIVETGTDTVVGFD